MSRATNINQTGTTWEFRDGQPLTSTVVPWSQPVIQTNYGPTSNIAVSGFDPSAFAPGQALAVTVTLNPDVAQTAINGNAIAYTSAASTSQVAATGENSMVFYFSSLGSVDPTDPTFSVQISFGLSSDGSFVEVAQVDAETASPQAPVNTAQPVAQTDYADGTVFCYPGGWDAFPAATFTYLWSNGQTTQTMTLSPSDAGVPLSCVVTATNALGSTSVTSTTVGPFFAPAWQTLHIAPVTTQLVGGGVTTPVFNSSIRMTGTYENTPFTPTFMWTWLANGTPDPTQTGSDYAPTLPAQAGETLTASVTITTCMGSTTSPTMTYKLPAEVTWTHSQVPSRSSSSAGVPWTGVTLPAIAWTDGTGGTQSNISGSNPGTVGTEWLLLKGIPSLPGGVTAVEQIGVSSSASFPAPDANRQVIGAVSFNNPGAPFYVIPEQVIPSANTTWTNSTSIPSGGLPLPSQVSTWELMLTFASAHASTFSIGVACSFQAWYSTETNLLGYTISV